LIRRTNSTSQPAVPVVADPSKYTRLTNLLIGNNSDFSRIIATYYHTGRHPVLGMRNMPVANPMQRQGMQQQVIQDARQYAANNPQDAANRAMALRVLEAPPAGTRRDASLDIAQWVAQLANQHESQMRMGATVFKSSGSNTALMVVLLLLLLGAGGFFLYRRKE